MSPFIQCLSKPNKRHWLTASCETVLLYTILCTLVWIDNPTLRSIHFTWIVGCFWCPHLTQHWVLFLFFYFGSVGNAAVFFISQNLLSIYYQGNISGVIAGMGWTKYQFPSCILVPFGTECDRSNYFVRPEKACKIQKRKQKKSALHHLCLSSPPLIKAIIPLMRNTASALESTQQQEETPVAQQKNI